MSPRSWDEYALQVAREGDTGAAERQELYQQQVGAYVDNMSRLSEQTAREELQRGRFPRNIE